MEIVGAIAIISTAGDKEIARAIQVAELIKDNKG